MTRPTRVASLVTLAASWGRPGGGHPHIRDMRLGDDQGMAGSQRQGSGRKASVPAVSATTWAESSSRAIRRNLHYGVVVTPSFAKQNSNPRLRYGTEGWRWC